MIAESESNAAVLFCARKTLYSTEGSSLCIRAMLYLARLQATLSGRRPLILAGRNAHKSFLTAAALLDMEIAWLAPEESGLLACPVSPEKLAARLNAMPELPVAVYITSPDYLGNMADIKALAEVCHPRGCLLLTDNAHGAYLRFLPEDRHPITLGADLCCDSAHKTLPVLTGGAYLHLARSAPSALTQAAETAMQLFASTSPSYLILQSLDAVNALLSGEYPAQLAAFCYEVKRMRERLLRTGWRFLGEEPIKLTLDAKAAGYRGWELARLLDDAGIVCEFADPDVTVLMLAPDNGEEDLRRIEAALSAIPLQDPLTEQPPKLPQPSPVLSPREALFSPCELLPVEACEGRILSQSSVSCPPAVPIAVCGERLSAAHLALFRYYGTEKIHVVR